MNTKAIVATVVIIVIIVVGLIAFAMLVKAVKDDPRQVNKIMAINMIKRQLLT